MATFKIELQKEKQDGTRNVKILLTHNRKLKRIPTSIFVHRKDITKSGKIKDFKVNESLDGLIVKYRSIANQAQDASIERLYELLVDVKSDSLYLFELAEEMIKTMNKGTGTLYRSMINSVKAYNEGMDIKLTDITPRFLQGYMEHLQAQGSTRAVSLYLGHIRAIHNEAKRRYNNEDEGVIKIPNSPFVNFKIPKDAPTRKRALTKEEILKIYNLPYCREPITRPSRYNLAKDVFLLSFFLIGINSADLYFCETLQDDVIPYFRTKTATRRADRAYFEVRVPEIAKHLLEKYKGEDRVFNFYKRFSNEKKLNEALNKGLKQIGEDVGIEDLEFYSARHSWATIAVNEAGVDKYTVHEALNHVDKEMKVTDIYIKKDFTNVNKANDKVLKYVFGE